MQEGTFYMSNPGKTQTFGKNNEFLKTFKHYKHYHDWLATSYFVLENLTI